MKEKCYVIMNNTIYDTGEYSGPREYDAVCAVAKTKEKAFELIQKISDDVFSMYRQEAHPVKTIENDGWRIKIECGCDEITIYCKEFDLE